MTATLHNSNQGSSSGDIFVSVVIPARNSLPDLDHQLNGLAAQNYAGPIEVIVADNGSDDGLSDHLRDHAKRDLLNLRRVDAGEQSGASYARNRGAVAAKGDFLAFCDADDVVHPAWLETLVELAGEGDVVGTAVETESVNTERALDWTPTTPPDVQGKTTFLPYAIGASLGCWASVYRDLDGMSCDLEASEDVEFCWRAQLNGYTLAFAPKQLVGYRLRDELVPLIKQSYKLGYGFAQLQGAYRDKGCPPVHLRRAMRWWVLLLLGNPLVPRTITRISRGQWLRAVAAHVGEFRGGLRHRAFVW
ncbi:MAG: glycosyltransferase [Rhodococcus sp. (in: high G+C Gram-positive bacteria)]